MALYFILGLAVFPAGVSACVFAVLVLGIRRGDYGMRLTGEPGSRAEVLARRVLTGSHGYDVRDDAGEDR